jgi:hypothetical protein
MSEFHAEPYVYLPTVTHTSALIAWGAFYFRVTAKGRWKLVEYTYKVFVKTGEWAQRERWDWSAEDHSLVQTSSASARWANRWPRRWKSACRNSRLCFALSRFRGCICSRTVAI